MKKFICTAVTFAMVVASITACGGKATETQAPATEAAQTVAVSEAVETEAPETEAAAPEVGSYVIYSAQNGSDDAMGRDILEAFGFTDENTYLNMKADGTLDIAICDDKSSGTWADGKMNIKGYEYTYEMDGDMITFSTETDDGTATYVFQKDDGVSESPGESAAAGQDFSGDYEEMGDGTAYIACASGTSQDGNIPVLFESTDTILEQIEIDSEKMDGSHLSYIYIDGKETAKEQLADSQVSLDLQGDALKEGVHKVEVVQYDTDDPSGTVITYKTASYEVKNK